MYRFTNPVACRSSGKNLPETDQEQLEYDAFDKIVDGVHKQRDLLELALRMRFPEKDIRISRKIQVKTRPKERRLAQNNECSARIEGISDLRDQIDACAMKEEDDVIRKCIFSMDNKTCVVRPATLYNEVIAVTIDGTPYLAKATYENYTTLMGAKEHWERSVRKELTHQTRVASIGIAPRVLNTSFMFRYSVEPLVYDAASGEKTTARISRKRQNNENEESILPEKKTLRCAVILMELVGQPLENTIAYNLKSLSNQRLVYFLFARIGTSICRMITECGVEHTDLHLENIRVASVYEGERITLKPIFIDFGISNRVSAQQTSTQSIVRNRCLEFYAKLEAFLRESQHKALQNASEMVSILQQLHASTTMISQGQDLSHAFYFEETGYQKDESIRYATPRDLFHDKLQTVPGMFFSPTVLSIKDGSKGVELKTIAPIYNVFDIDNFTTKNTIGTLLSGFRAARYILSSEHMEPIWDSDVKVYRDTYNTNMTRDFVKSDMQLVHVVCKLFHGWKMLSQSPFEPQYMLSRNVVSTRCAIQREAPHEPTTLNQFENELSVPLKSPNYLLSTLNGHKRRVNSASFSADGTRIVSTSEDNTVRVWDANMGEQELRLDGHYGAVFSACFSPDGTRIVSASDDRTIRVWDVGKKVVEAKTT